MTKYFVVATDPLSADHETELSEFLGPSDDAAWWHWLPNFWLVNTDDATMTAARIRDFINSKNDKARALVLEVQPKAWAALTKPDPKGNDMAEWIRKYWPEPPS